MRARIPAGRRLAALLLTAALLGGAGCQTDGDGETSNDSSARDSNSEPREERRRSSPGSY